MKKLFAVLVFAIIAVVCVRQNIFAQQNPQKFALVIGNGVYTGISMLNNPVNDANDMEAALKGLGFSVDKVLNGNLDQMETALANLKRRLSASRNTYGFFFYAGHGVQSNGVNYLIPVDANNIQSENHLRQRAVSVQTLMDNLGDAGNELNMVVLDACRDNPFGWARSGSRGLSVVSAPAGSIVMYATSANSSADDGRGRNGLFTGQLLNNIKNQGLNIRDVFDKTGEDVLNASGGKQHPEISIRFFGASTAYLGSRPAAPQQAQPAQPSSSVSQPAPAPQTAQPAPAPQPVPVTPAAVPQHSAPQGFVRINGGTFTMDGRQVTISSFSLGKYEVTQKEYQEVTGTNPSNFKGDNLPVERVSWYDAVEYCNARSRKEGLTPAYTIDKSRKDTNNKNEYDGVKWTVTWNRGANGYRLPTEAEWEYAARGGNGSPGNFTYSGSEIAGEVAWFKDNSGNRTQEVGKKKANNLGLHDMSGNVGEWCWDWYGTYPSGSQTDPTGASSGSYRVVRGGSWYDSAVGARSVYRGSSSPSYRIIDVGFRLVRP